MQNNDVGAGPVLHGLLADGSADVSRAAAEALVALLGLGAATLAALKQRRRCAVCGERAKEQCSGCRGVWYCSGACQQQQWRQHRSDCRKIQAVLGL